MSDKKRNRYLWGLVLLTFGLSMMGLATVMTVMDVERGVPSAVTDKIDLGQVWEQELKAGEYVTIVDSKTGEVVDMISRQVYNGDTLIAEDNKKYEIINVKDNKATAKMVGVDKDVVWKPEWDQQIAKAGAQQGTPAQAGDKAQIAMYYTHSSESYVPTDGTESIPGRGGIMKVGSVFAEALRKKGVTVAEDRTPHEPHDSGAYHRSRRTAVQLLGKQPIALIDVHRDGVPDPDFYYDKVQGEDVTKIRLVVGRQNPNMATNLEFAKRVKGFIDKEKPGLIRGIFIGRGNYNQDLGPKAMLIEVGTHTNSRFKAQSGAQLFADALPNVLGLDTATPGGGGGGGTGITNPLTDSPAESRSAWTTLAWILGIVLIGAAAFLFISTGSIKGMKSKIGELSKTEFANYLGDDENLKKDSQRQKSKSDPDK